MLAEVIRSSADFTAGTIGFTRRELSIDTTQSSMSVVEFLRWMWAWTAELPDDELERFAEAITPLITRWSRTRDAADLRAIADLAERWQATAEAYQNHGLLAALADEDDPYVPWE